MAEGRGRAEWARTAAMMALTANCNRDPKQTPKPFTAEMFDPYAQRKKAAVEKAPIGILKKLFVKRKG